jgi:hypothetical protein
MKIVALIIALCLVGGLWSQVPGAEQLEEEIESIAEGNEENQTDLVQLAENLALLKAEPIAINFADAEELSRIPYLNIFQVSNLLAYRDQCGKIYSHYELLAIKGFDRSLVAQILEFLDFRSRPQFPSLKWQEIRRYSRHNLVARSILDLQEREGFKIPKSEGGFQGGRPEYYLRYRGRYRDILATGFTLQHDAGEPFAGAQQSYGFDFASGHLALNNYGPIKRLIIGDYQAEFGQGLALWSSLAFGKGASILQTRRFGRGLIPYSGADENRFLRGVAGTFQHQNWELSLFYSNHAQDANISERNESDLPQAVSSIQSTGLHRNASELEDKHANRLKMWGANLNYRGEGFRLGLTGLQQSLQLPLQPRDNQLYQWHRLAGRSWEKLSLDFNYLYRDLNLFGEVAYQTNGSWAASLGLLCNPADGFYLSLLHRNLNQGFESFYNAPFGEAGTAGEVGNYLGIDWEISPLLSMRSYLDLYRFRWLRFGVDGPSQGRDALIQFNFKISRYFKSYLRYRFEQRQISPAAQATEAVIHPLIPELRQSWRLHQSHELSSRWRLASRVEWSLYQENFQKEQGWMVYQDLRYQLLRSQLTLTGRIAFIQTPSFNTRIYAYENDLSYAFSIPPYYGQATRLYLLTDWDPWPSLSIQAKYAISRFYDRDFISSGLNQIQGPVQSELRLQVVYKF